LQKYRPSLSKKSFTRLRVFLDIGEFEPSVEHISPTSKPVFPQRAKSGAVRNDFSTGLKAAKANIKLWTPDHGYLVPTLSHSDL
jgi:hypothetical protein